jgi:SAM-dependent methyltransferase
MPGSEPADRGTYLLERCPACGTAVTCGTAAADAHQSGAYAAAAPRGAGLAAPLLDVFDRQRLRMLGEPRGRLLDVGAGRGRFVAAARAAGWDAAGLEPFPRGDAPFVETVALEQAAYDGLDAITLWHVLEHLEDPTTSLARLHGWLRPGGTLVVGVPNLGSLQARVGGPRWFHLDLPRHRTHFTALGLNSALARAGLRPLRTVHLLAEHNPFGLWQSLVNRLTPTPSWLYNALKRNAPLRAADLLPTVAALPLLPAAVLLEALAGATGRGGTIAVIAQR